MSSSISERISIAEDKWLELVRPFISGLFEDVFIPSHDHCHHHRVWILCKKLLLELESFSSIADANQVEGLLLASWFHDAGMVRDQGELHGACGRDIFEGFMAESGMQKPDLYEEILDIITFHDSKERSLYPDIIPGKAPGMMGLLSMADDLDALGVVGIYRYIEIYLKRGLGAGKLGVKVLANVSKRFNNILDSCSACPGLLDDFLADYQMIEQFFNRYNQQVLCVPEAERINWGELGVVNYIRVFSVEGRVRPEAFIHQSALSASEGFAKSYFKRLHDELEFKCQ